MSGIKLSLKKVGAIFIGLIVVLLLALSTKIGEDVQNNQIVINQYPFTGKMAYWTQPGFQWQWFGKTTEYYKTNQIWFNEINEDSEGNLDITGLDKKALSITYADKGKGYVLGSVRIELPREQYLLQKIHEDYGNERRLYDELVRPTLGKVILACGPLMTSLESVSEKRNDLIAHATDQLNDGIYRTRAIRVQKLNAITGEQEWIDQAEIVRDTLGNPIRGEESPFAKYGLTVSQLAIADLKYEKATNDQIAKQREADMQIITAKAEAARAVQKAITEEKEGEARATKAKWEEEEKKARAVVQAEQAFQVMELQAKEALEYAKKVRAEGEAEAAKNRALVSAGLTPLEKATIEKDTKIGVAKALAESKVSWVPTYMLSGNGGSSNNAMDAVGLKMMMDVVNSVSK